MKLEDQVCSLALSRQLRDLGVRQDSLFYWLNRKIVCPTFQEFNFPEDWTCAFTVAELGELLPGTTLLNFHKKCTFTYYVRHNRDIKNNILHPFSAYDTNEANARAKMLVYLIENKLIDAETLK